MDAVYPPESGKICTLFYRRHIDPLQSSKAMLWWPPPDHVENHEPGDDDDECSHRDQWGETRCAISRAPRVTPQPESRGPHGLHLTAAIREPLGTRSARQIGWTPWASRGSSMKAIIFERAVDLRHRKIGRCLAHDLVGLVQFPSLAFQNLPPLSLAQRHASRSARLNTRPLHSIHQRVGRAPDLLGNRRRCRRSRRVFRLMVQNHPHRLGTNLRAESVRRFAHHSSALLERGRLQKTRGSSRSE